MTFFVVWQMTVRKSERSTAIGVKETEKKTAHIHATRALTKAHISNEID